MNFEEFWNKTYESLKEKQILSTIEHGKIFTAHSKDGKIIITPKVSGEERPISKEDLIRAWSICAKLSPGERFKAGNYSVSKEKTGSFQSSYVVALLRRFLRNTS